MNTRDLLRLIEALPVFGSLSVDDSHLELTRRWKLQRDDTDQLQTLLVDYRRPGDRLHVADKGGSLLVEITRSFPYSHSEEATQTNDSGAARRSGDGIGFV